MNEKQKNSLRRLKSLEFAFAFVFGAWLYPVIKHDFFNGEPVNHAGYCFALLLLIAVWLAVSTRVNYPEE